MATTVLSTSIQPCSPKGEFVNEPFTDFKTPENARKMQEALGLVSSQLGREYDLVIGGEPQKPEENTRPLTPAPPPEVVGIHQRAGAGHVDPAMTAALRAFES